MINHYWQTVIVSTLCVLFTLAVMVICGFKPLGFEIYIRLHPEKAFEEIYKMGYPENHNVSCLVTMK